MLKILIETVLYENTNYNLWLNLMKLKRLLYYINMQKLLQEPNMLYNKTDKKEDLQLNIKDAHCLSINPVNYQAVSFCQNYPSIRETFLLHKPTSKTSNQQQSSKVQEMGRRAHYQECKNCPPIKLVCKVVQQLNEQNSTKLQISPQLDKILSLQRQFNVANQTKNIAKNYGKAIIGFIRKNKNIFRSICEQSHISHRLVLQELPYIKTMLSTIAGFRKAWTQYKYAACLRRVSNHFLRKYVLHYVLTSKIQNIKSHIKYRNKFLEALKNPKKFDHMKDY